MKAFFRALLLAAAPLAALGQSLPNGGFLYNNQEWTVPQWIAAWQSKVDVTNGVLNFPTLNSPTFSITGLTQCLHVNSLGVVTGTGSDCGGGGGGGNFGSLGGGINTSANMQVGTGSSLSATGGGVLSANQMNGATVPASSAVLSSNSLGQLTAAAYTGTGNVVLSSGATLSAENLGTPTSLVLTNGTLLPLTTGVTGILGTANGGIGASSFTAAGLSTFSGSLTSGHCAQWSTTTGNLVDSGAGCGSGSSSAFSALTSSSNSTAAMVVTSGASLSASGTGTIAATSVTGLSVTGGKTLSISNTLTLAGTDGNTYTFPSISDNIVGATAAQTLTNKSIAASEINSGTLAPAQGGTGASSLAAANIPVQSGAITTGDCAQWASGTSISDAGSACGTGFIAGSFTSAQVIANYAPSSNTGKKVLTSDMGLLESDGVRWNVRGTPPIPPGALILSYNHNVFTYFPTLADVTTGNAQVVGGAKIYPGYLGLNSATIGSFSTAGNGQLQLAYTGTSGQNGIFTIVPYHTAVLGSDYGQLGLAVGSRGYYVEIAYTDSSNNTDIWDTMFVEPQEHNPLQNDSNPNFGGGTGWEQWHEKDVNESGHGTDYSGAYRGAYLKWSGHYNWSNTFVSAPSGTITTFPNLTNAWTGESGTENVYLSSGQTISSVFTNGSKVVTCASTTITGSPSATFTTSYYTYINSSNYQTASLDYTVEHIFGGAYDPVGQTWTIWQDGVMQSQISTASAQSTDGLRDALHYMIVVAAQSHGAHFAHSMTVRYISMWTP